jgi:FkbM family methyltransferase
MISKALRTLQCLLPAIRPFKFATYNFGTKVFGWPMEEDFRLLAKMAPVGLALDIGANWGQSIHALQRTARPQKIVAFEPNPVLAARLERKYSGDEKVSIQSAALADREGTFKLYVPSYRGYLFDGLASLDYDSAANWLNEDRIFAFKPEALSIVEHDVPVKILDDFRLKPDVVKIDVQGMELAVIQGGRETFSTSKPLVIVETPSQDVVAALAESGLLPYRFHAGKLIAGDTTGLNTMFIHPDRKARLDIL